MLNLSFFIWVLILFFIIVILYVYWRFFFFFRDPDRVTPEGKNIIAPADGTVVYIKKVNKGEIPIAIKKRRSINLEEIFKYKSKFPEVAYLVGIFMHPTSVHVNRAPISGNI